LVVDALDLAVASGPFGWAEKPATWILTWEEGSEETDLEAECRYRGLAHLRRIVLRKPDMPLVTDRIADPSGEQEVEQFWHAGEPVRQVAPASYRIGGGTILALREGVRAELIEGMEHGWRATAHCVNETAPVIRVYARAALPLQPAVVLDFSCSGARGQDFNSLSRQFRKPSP
jgi:hypothetical protein